MNRAIASLGLCVLLASLGTSIANVGLPAIAAGVSASYAQVQWVVLAYLLPMTAFVAIAGRMGDCGGQRRLLLAGLGMFSLGSLLCALAGALPWLAAARALQGLGAAAILSNAMALAASSSPGKVGSAMGAMGAMSAAGTALGPGAGGVLLSVGPWPLLFLATVPPGLLALLLAWRWLPAERGEAGRDAPARHAPPGDTNWRRHGPLAAVSVANAMVAAVMMATLVIGPFYLAGALGLSSAGTGLVMSAGPLVAALAGLPSGAAVDRFGGRPVACTGLALGAAACILMPTAAQTVGAPGYLAALCALTAGYALFQAGGSTAALSSSPAAQRGQAAGLLALARSLGLLGGAALMAWVFALGTGGADPLAAPPAALAGGMRLCFGLAALLMLAALAVCALGLPAGGPARQPGACVKRG